jgi:hypothetical protein
MRFIAVTLALWLASIASSVPNSASAADAPRLFRVQPDRIVPLPFPRSERAQSVWESGACWSDCGAYCAWGQAACLKVDTQGACIASTDACDRYCQKTCRSSGGPFLPITD